MNLSSGHLIGDLALNIQLFADLLYLTFVISVQSQIDAIVGTFHHKKACNHTMSVSDNELHILKRILLSSHGSSLFEEAAIFLQKCRFCRFFCLTAVIACGTSLKCGSLLPILVPV